MSDTLTIKRLSNGQSCYQGTPQGPAETALVRNYPKCGGEGKKKLVESSLAADLQEFIQTGTRTFGEAETAGREFNSSMFGLILSAQARFYPTLKTNIPGYHFVPGGSIILSLKEPGSLLEPSDRLKREPTQEELVDLHTLKTSSGRRSDRVFNVGKEFYYQVIADADGRSRLGGMVYRDICVNRSPENFCSDSWFAFGAGTLVAPSSPWDVQARGSVAWWKPMVDHYHHALQLELYGYATLQVLTPAADANPYIQGTSFLNPENKVGLQATWYYELPSVSNLMVHGGLGCSEYLFNQYEGAGQRVGTLSAFACGTTVGIDFVSNGAARAAAAFARAWSGTN